MNQRVSLKSLAEELGLDVSTVSRALRSDPRVRPETADAVRKLAAQRDYRPNALARALRGGKTGRVAVLLSPPQQRFASPIFLELLAALDQRLRDSGRSLAVFAARDRSEEPDIVRQIVDDGLADAVVMGRTQRNDRRVRWLIDRGFPFVTFGRSDWPEAHPWVEIDYAAAGGLSVSALAAAAPSALHLLAAPQGQNFADNFVTGALAGARAAGLPPPIVHRVEMTEEQGEARALTILAAAPRGIALACIQDSLAFGVFRAAARAGWRVGRDLALVGGQNFPGSEHTAPPLSTFSTDDARVAALLSEVTLRRLEAKGPPPGGWENHVILPRPLLRQSHLLSGGQG
jgi:LacI family transcriptional regulator